MVQSHRGTEVLLAQNPSASSGYSSLEEWLTRVSKNNNILAVTGSLYDDGRICPSEIITRLGNYMTRRTRG
jgi:hypothetical protein